MFGKMFLGARKNLLFVLNESGCTVMSSHSAAPSNSVSELYHETEIKDSCQILNAFGHCILI